MQFGRQSRTVQKKIRASFAVHGFWQTILLPIISFGENDAAVTEQPPRATYHDGASIAEGERPAVPLPFYTAR